MADLVRFGVSIPDDLLDKFDVLIAEQGYTNRSEAIRDLIRNRFVDDVLCRTAPLVLDKAERARPETHRDSA